MAYEYGNQMAYECGNGMAYEYGKETHIAWRSCPVVVHVHINTVYLLGRFLHNVSHLHMQTSAYLTLAQTLVILMNMHACTCCSIYSVCPLHNVLTPLHDYVNMPHAVRQEII